MKIKQTYKTAAICAAFLTVWMISGSLVEEENFAKSDSSLDTLSSVTILNSKAIDKSKILKSSGFTEADKFVQVRAELSGRVVSRPAKQGDFVEKGDLICQLYIAGREAYPKIVAPFSGYLESLKVDEGDFLNTGAVCASLIDPDPMLLVADIAEKDIAQIQLGSEASAKLISGRLITGNVSFIASSADKNTRTFRVEISVDNKDRSIRDGVSAEIYIKGKEEPAHRISPAILALNDQGKLGIRTVTSDNTVEFREINILEDTNNGMWVSGLGKEARIITLGQEYVFQGQTVNVKETFSPEA
ncbi:efflux RND transporter periplasmic adaptor subunit [Gammaproteobacteria bacterium]|nr:efflux RND transporter periplasmic adaptor subunit [Gammaproteobacteria bacterium]MDC0508975.1 efflux RND transporter periplasmic adaptor subunit [Gammaproteobacteria bacterium]MDC0576809.1 efflux RND transporter periplasmic adaptor subunit [Gammaproteobacteria bacterium]